MPHSPQQVSPQLWTIRSTDHLARHSGQISFPGGRSEEADPSPAETALRETFEETGIAPGFVTVAGYLEPYLTRNRFDIQAVVRPFAPRFHFSSDSPGRADS